MAKEEDFFEKYGLSIEKTQPELDKWYPIFGMVTNVLDERKDYLEVEVNYNIKMKILTDKQESREIIKNRALETGIFHCKFTSLDEETNIYTADCKTVIFGKPQLTEN